MTILICHSLTVCDRIAQPVDNCIMSGARAQVMLAQAHLLRDGDRVEANIPAKSLADDCPTYFLEAEEPEFVARLRAFDPSLLPEPADTGAALLALLGSPSIASKRWVWEQYDHIILGNTVQRPGGDAAVVRVQDGPKGLAFTTDVTPRYCEADPVEGGKQAVAEAWRTVSVDRDLPG